jgi:hypothetical protein
MSKNRKIPYVPPEELCKMHEGCDDDPFKCFKNIFNTMLEKIKNNRSIKLKK